LPTYLNGMGRGLLPADHPSHFSLSRGKALQQADLVITAGTPLDFRLKYGAFNPSARLIQIEPDATTFGQNRATDVGIIGDVAATMEALRLALLEQGVPAFTAWRDQVAAIESQRRAEQAVLEQSDATPINHFRLAREIDETIDDKTTVIGDGGDVVAMAARV